MLHHLEELLSGYESGRIDRRQLLAALLLVSAAPATLSAVDKL